MRALKCSSMPCCLSRLKTFTKSSLTSFFFLEREHSVTGRLSFRYLMQQHKTIDNAMTYVPQGHGGGGGRRRMERVLYTDPCGGGSGWWMERVLHTDRCGGASYNVVHTADLQLAVATIKSLLHHPTHTKHTC